jgi:hypothetical protein
MRQYRGPFGLSDAFCPNQFSVGYTINIFGSDLRQGQVWRGTGRDGSGNLSADSGVLAETPYSFRTRFENEKGTNPEELITAAHAGCFTMALAFQLQGAGFAPTELNTEAAVRGLRIPYLSVGSDPAGSSAEPGRMRRYRGLFRLSDVDANSRRTTPPVCSDLISDSDRMSMVTSAERADPIITRSPRTSNQLSRRTRTQIRLRSA